ncbi:STAS domain-containing protein [Pedobacter sp. MC2016-05]|jgi:anti-anti-sigma regulatory factor|uniref:STAS domain-containing protein n=1 Tax=unclassified Pedobacter TaxID=2628915 RepID=UPI0007029E89|nr:MULTISPECIES: STAS domain-containing protein [unclassified Pedobacter]KQN38724.1 anti-anti-sigma factor [Pedobacter sp. Leaf41]MCX2474485.1 STAS domain-containing protein [Pedobacter sp. MC2016-05]RZK66864.1 MAG: anti-sigma factor antagonist [Pedobacter sp.]
MKFSVDKHDKYVTLKLKEPKFTNDNSPGLKSELYLLNAEGFKNIIVDLSHVKECTDAQDLSCLLVGDRLCKSAGGLFIVTGINDEIAPIIELSNIFQSVTFVNTLEEATDFIFMDELEKEFRGAK